MLLDADAALLVYDMKNLKSLTGVEYYLKELSNNARTDVCILCVTSDKYSW